MAKVYVDLSDTINAWREKTNVLSSDVGDLDNLTVPADHDSDIVQAINYVYNFQPIRDERLIIKNASGVIVKDLYGFDDSGG
tara:strand:- start:574 stop:819 length:246 start_codon:yes stop_codon:yes gene_type:complete